MLPNVGDISRALYIAPNDSPEISQEYDEFTDALKRMSVELDCEQVGLSTPRMSVGKDSFEESLSNISKYGLVIANVSQPSEFVGQRAQVSSSLGRMLVATYPASIIPSRMILGASHLRLNDSSRDNAAALAKYLKENSNRPLQLSPKLRQLDLSEAQDADPLEFALKKAKPIAYVAFPITSVPDESRERVRDLVRRIGILLNDLAIEVRDLEHRLTDPNTPRGRNASPPNIHQTNHSEITRADFVILLTSDQIGSTGVGMEHAMASYDGKPQIHVGASSNRAASIFHTRWVSQRINNSSDDRNLEELTDLLKDYRSPFVRPARYKLAAILDKIFAESGLSHHDINRKMELEYGDPIKSFSLSNIPKLRNPDKYRTRLPSPASILLFCGILKELDVDARLIMELKNFRA